MAKPEKAAVDRRNFLKTAAVGAAALAAPPGTLAAQQAEMRRSIPPSMSPEAESGTPSNAEVLTADRTGSDFMVDVIKSLGFEYVCANGSGFHQVGRCAEFADALCRIRCTSVQDCDDAADIARRISRGWRVAGEPNSCRRQNAHPKAYAGGATSRRFRSGRRSGAAA